MNQETLGQRLLNPVRGGEGLNLADFLRQGLSPLQQQRMADDSSMTLAGELARHGTVAELPAKYNHADPYGRFDKSVVAPSLGEGQRQREVEMVMNLMPGAGITAFHGSPHKFTKFDMSKIGTGEGAQTYGHGLYAAENPRVAKDYQEKLASRDFLHPDGSVFDPFEHLVNRNVRATLQKTDGDVQATIDRANELIKSIPGTQGADYAQKDIDVLSKLQGLKRSDGHLYKLDIPDDQIAKMLDWDKPLSGQAESVQSALGEFNQKYTDPKQALEDFLQTDYAKSFPDVKDVRWAKEILTNPDYDVVEDGGAWLASQMRAETGSSFYNLLGSEKGGSMYERLASKLGDNVGNLSNSQHYPNASEYLKSKGIPGIKYLDGGSRSGGKGTSNFVMFSDDIAEILERNGQPISELAEALKKSKDMMFTGAGSAMIGERLLRDESR